MLPIGGEPEPEPEPAGAGAADDGHGALLANLGACVARRGPEAAGGGVPHGGRLEPRELWCGLPPPHPDQPPTLLDIWMVFKPSANLVISLWL